MSDPIPTPGVRVGQIWQRIKVKGNGYPFAEVCGTDAADVHYVPLNAERHPTGAPPATTPRVMFEQRYRLVSEGGAPDA